MSRQSSRSATSPAGVRVETTLLGLVIVLSVGCSWTSSDFAKTASDVGSTLAAAETTLRLRHDDRLTRAYAQAGFENYREALEGTRDQLPQLAGAPDASRLERLVRSLEDAEPILKQPCLDDGCDWHGQIERLARAKDAFLEAAGP